MANLGIVGYGYVGKAVEFGFKDKNNIFIHDKYLPSLPLAEIVNKSDFIFVAVPTPMTAKYTKIDISIVDEVFKNIVALAKKQKREPIIVIKSTVVPGSTKKLAKKYNWPKTLFNPEFLTEANFLQDFVNADRVIVGGEDTKINGLLTALYKDSLPNVPVMETDSTSAEMVKYMANTYLATKVIFGYQMYDLCQALGIDYDGVKLMTVADKRIGATHLNVSSKDTANSNTTDRRGFGGKCFPKDTVALLGLAKELGVSLSVLESAWKHNLAIRKVRDWEDIPGAVSKKS